jgi:hypothetical protein
MDADFHTDSPDYRHAYAHLDTGPYADAHFDAAGLADRYCHATDQHAASRSAYGSTICCSSSHRYAGPNAYRRAARLCG